MIDYKRLTKYKGEPLHTDMEVTDGDEIYERLAELEDLIEQGLLVKLPCKVGDPVYEVIPKCKGSFHYCPYNGGFGDSRCEKSCNAYIEEGKFDLYMLEHIGKTIFLTEAKAKARVAKLNSKR